MVLVLMKFFLKFLWIILVVIGVLEFFLIVYDCIFLILVVK